MTSKTVAGLLDDLGVTRSHSRPKVSRGCQYLWVGVFQATSVPVCCSPFDGGVGGVMSVGRSSSLPLRKTAPGWFRYPDRRVTDPRS